MYNKEYNKYREEITTFLTNTMKTTYKTGAQKMSDEQVFNEYCFYRKYSRLSDKYTSTPNRVKASYFESILNKRGYSDEKITDMVNEKLSAEYRAEKSK